VIGNDTAITTAGALGNFELNAMMPVMAHNLLESIELLANGARVFAARCVAGLEADRERCERNIEQSLALCTPLAPIIGYDKAAEIAKAAYSSGRTVREVAAERAGLSPEELERLMNPARMC
jgi:fumarate hydratase class II